ncbi:Mating response protein [Komagataella phaffii CBS 7435]|uniref:Protein involved in mating response, invasive/filamentous growth, and osmotolerance n=2 Tax=Komagataella phaffii TaxID=460519 RepID=C4QWV1_KOMPG|nr:Protein involved in mating response, invasive/filamentous growth, and osmotolerance [Komagataella phaffii GS115]AOA61080.1 GQ67_02931T0 [Komagataella phaffii]CAH2446517.1 Mating response protein [Komagataella phaffii CBS 7435]AOA66397.1 GQ68_02316T0 [Komagataella phaffii GS115]CAY67724.1 Protein involved in mating response, invasive/filamentous growth, and osmotolerance [Komagataella phaffii GS115]CCA36812.1 Mating response protein [Komagataella phaffii CBS 7435]
MTDYVTSKRPDNVLNWTSIHVSSWIGETIPEIDPSLLQNFLEHDIAGDVLPYLKSEDLKEIGINELKHRISIKKNIHELLVSNEKHIDTSILSDTATELGTLILTNKFITQMANRKNVVDDSTHHSNNRRLTEQFNKLRKDLLPIFKWIKETQPLPTPENTHFANMGSVPASPVEHTSGESTLSNPSLSTINAGEGVNSAVAGQSLGRKPTLSSRRQSHALSPTGEHLNVSSSSPSTGNFETLNGERPNLRSASSGSQEHTENELLKPLRVKADEPCYKVIQNAMKRHGLSVDDWRKYALVICYGDEERVLGLHEKPGSIFKELKDQKQNPAIMLRQIDTNNDDQNHIETPGGRL